MGREAVTATIAADSFASPLPDRRAQDVTASAPLISSFRGDWLEVPATSVNLMYEILADAGHDADALLRDLGIPFAVLGAPGTRIGWRQEVDFQKRFAALTEADPYLWIRAARTYSHAAFGFLGLAFAVAPTIRHWYTLSTSLDMNYSLGAYRTHEIGPSQSSMEVVFPDDLDRGSPLFRFSVIRDVVAGAAVLEQLWRSPFPLALLELPLDAVPAELTDIIDCQIVTGAAALRWVWSASIDDIPLPQGNPTLFAFYRDHAAKADGWVRAPNGIDQKVLEILRRSDQAGLGIQHVANKLQMTSRTLQRHLADAGISFRELREMARQEEACRLLANTDHSVADIADILGYFEIASFSNAFRRWTGASPSAYRNRRRSC